MRMRLEGVKKGLVPSSTPVAVPVPVTISIPIAAATCDSIPVAIAVAVPAVAPENAIRETCPAVRSAAVPTSITGVVTVNKLPALPIIPEDPAVTSLS